MSPDWADKPEEVPYSVLGDPQSLNLYSYVRNHPVNAVDADGHCPEGDDVCIATSDTMVGSPFHGETLAKAWDQFKGAVKGFLNDVALANPKNNAFDMPQLLQPSNGDQAAGMALGSLALGGVGAPEAEAAEVSTITQSAARGLKSEARVLESIGETKNTTSVSTAKGTSIPDFMNTKVMGEIKDTKAVNNTPQLQIQKEAAKQSNRDHQLITGVNTKVSKPAAAGTTVIRRKDLGPQ